MINSYCVLNTLYELGPLLRVSESPTYGYSNYIYQMRKLGL